MVTLGQKCRDQPAQPILKRPVSLVESIMGPATASQLLQMALVGMRRMLDIFVHSVRRKTVVHGATAPNHFRVLRPAAQRNGRNCHETLALFAGLRSLA